MNTQPKLTFTLAGELVSDAAHAKRILVAAIHKDQAWLVPQAESVLRHDRVGAVRRFDGLQRQDWDGVCSRGGPGCRRLNLSLFDVPLSHAIGRPSIAVPRSHVL